MRRKLEDRTMASVPAAGAEVRAEDNASPEEVEVIGKAKGVADPAGLLKPKLRPVVEVVVETGAPVKKPICFVYLYKYNFM